MNGRQLSPMARAVAYLIRIASEDDEEADPGDTLASEPGPAVTTNGQARRLDSRLGRAQTQAEVRRK